jgi:hypothetical protein
MLELPVAAAGCDLKPSIVLDKPNGIANLHAGILRGDVVKNSYLTSFLS